MAIDLVRVARSVILRRQVIVTNDLALFLAAVFTDDAVAAKGEPLDKIVPGLRVYLVELLSLGPARS